MQRLTFYGINEAQPGPRWRALFDATWPGYRTWYLSQGEAGRPDLRTAEAALRRHMPELVPTWERLVDLADGAPDAARMLTLFDPPAFAPACSQAVVLDGEPALLRNYDYAPDLCERTVYSSRFTGRRVIGTGDCLWGLVDGMNEDGLVVSLAFGGRPGAGPGFAIPLVLRYLLETADTIPAAVAILERLPVSMAYNLTMLDRRLDAATVFVAPGRRPEMFRQRAATNHRGRTPDVPDHARRFRSVERLTHLDGLLDARTGVEALAQELVRAPLHQDDYAGGFGTVYTAAYRPTRGCVDLHWPGSTWRRRFDSPDATHSVVLRSRHGSRTPR